METNTLGLVTRRVLIDTAEALDYPTQGKFAWDLWQLCSSGRIPYDEACRLYRECGYIPFCGYPLARCGKLGKMTRDEATKQIEYIRKTRPQWLESE